MNDWLVVDGVADPNWIVVDGKKYEVWRTVVKPEAGRGPEVLCSYEDEEGEMYLWAECLRCGPDGSAECPHWPVEAKK